MIKNTRKFITRFILIVLITCLGYIGYMLFTFDLFDANINKLKEINIHKQGYKIAIYQINGNATVQSGIQVRKIVDGKEFSLIQYDRYDALISNSVQNDSLKLVLANTNLGNNKVDTLYLKLP